MTQVPAGKIASVVTYLQMFERPPRRAEVASDTWAMRRADLASLAWYHPLFRRIGEDWLWYSRLYFDDHALGDVLRDARYETYIFEVERREAGLVELDFRTEGEAELSFFGLVPEMVGLGAGRWLMNRVLERAWQEPIRRLWVHTCSLDHPGALAFYLRSGFAPFRREVEIADDLRLTGVLPPTAAPHIPLIRGAPWSNDSARDR